MSSTNGVASANSAEFGLYFAKSLRVSSSLAVFVAAPSGMLICFVRAAAYLAWSVESELLGACALAAIPLAPVADRRTTTGLFMLIPLFLAAALELAYEEGGAEKEEVLEDEGIFVVDFDANRSLVATRRCGEALTAAAVARALAAARGACTDCFLPATAPARRLRDLR